MKPGTFHTIRIHDINSIPDTAIHKVFGVRIAKFLPNGWEHWDGLTPSKNLLFAAKKLERENSWNSETFKEMYMPRFLKEILTNSKAQEEMKKISTILRSGHDVYYACYCKDATLCHRGILAELYKRHGFNVIKK